MTKGRLTIVMTAWMRYAIRLVYFRRIVVALKKHLCVSAANCRLEDVVVDWLVAAESLGCDLETKRLFAELCGDQGIRVVWHEGPPDLGDCLNLMISRVETELLMYIQDDWELHTPARFS